MASVIPVGASTDTYQYLGNLHLDGLLRHSAGNAASVLQQFESGHGPVMQICYKEVQSAALSGATSNVGTNFIPAGALPLIISLFVTTAITLAAGTTWTAGDGTTADLYGTGLLLTVGDTLNVMKTATSPKFYASAANLVLTGTGGNFTGGVVRAGMIYIQRAALLS